MSEKIREVELEGSKRHPAETEGEGCDRKDAGFEDSERKNWVGCVLGVHKKEDEYEDPENQDNGGRMWFF